MGTLLQVWKKGRTVAEVECLLFTVYGSQADANLCVMSLWWKDEVHSLQPGCLLSPVTLYWLSEQVEPTESFIYVLIYLKYMNMGILCVCVGLQLYE